MGDGKDTRLPRALEGPPRYLWNRPWRGSGAPGPVCSTHFNFEAMSKETLLAAADRLPDHFELDELIDRLLLIQKIEKGREQSRNDQTHPQEEVKQLAKTWFK